MKKIISRIGIKTVILLAISCFMLSACAIDYKPNFAKDRQAALKEDKALLTKMLDVKQDKPLTLDDAIKISINNNLELRVNRILKDAADEKVVSEKLKMLPMLNLEGDIVRRSEYDISYYKYVNPDTMEPYGQIKVDQDGAARTLTVSDDKEIFSGNIKLSWNVLDFGLTYIKAKQKAMGAVIKDIETDRQTQRLTAKVFSAYWKAVIADKNLERIPKVEQMLNEYKNVIQKAVNEKRVSPIALKEAENKIIELSIKTTEIQAQLEAARIELARLMGISPAIAFKLADADVECFVTNLPEPKNLNVNELEDVALKNRPELFATDIELQIQKQEAKALLLRMLPGLRFDAVQLYNSNDFLVNNSWSTVGANLAWDIFGLPAKYYAKKAQKKNIAAAQTKRIELTAAIMTQLRLALHDFAIKKKTFNYFNDFYTNHEDIVRIGAEYHKAGMLCDADMVERSIERFTAKLGRDESLAHMLDSFATLAVTLGIDYDKWSGYYTNKNCGAPVVVKPKKESVKTVYIYFDFGKADLKTKYYPILDKVVSQIKQDAASKIKIQGYTGDIRKGINKEKYEKYNVELSKKRSAVIKQYLVSKGLISKRITTAWFGSKDPASKKHLKNRRVELIIE
ncbi:MAG: TolC family protein [Deltaproteobacteria bacterium]|nr:TolC family protein [Deltaproteobacteria bacterium]